jgi:actin-related protein
MEWFEAMKCFCDYCCFEKTIEQTTDDFPSLMLEPVVSKQVRNEIPEETIQSLLQILSYLLLSTVFDCPSND